jgi:hypothetical protein
MGLHSQAVLPPGKNAGIHSVVVWVDPKASLEVLQEREHFFTLPRF